MARRPDGFSLMVIASATRVDWRGAEDHGGEKGDAHLCLAAERPLDQGVHDEDDGDDGEEDSVNVDVERRRRSLVARRAPSFPGSLGTLVVLYKDRSCFLGVASTHAANAEKRA